MPRLISALVLACLLASRVPVNAQITLTAHDLTPQWVEPYGYGSNMGVFFPNYYDMEVATLLCGNAAKQVEGIGATTIRPALFEFLVDYFGYDIRLQHFNYYKDIGAQNVTCFVGNPSEAHRDPVQHCPGRASAAFKNMYTPIWDNGENGTPVNDTNYYAVFCWKMATMYKDLVRIWEITNEPDLVYDWVAAGSPPGTPGNWWENPADPCTYQMSAPVYYYIRMLRISYEVMKGVDPSCRIATGGIGWPSFLDQLCRYTDNPDGGKVSPEYPLAGGAYFDCLSFHTYPHIDGSMRKWDNSIGGFKYSRHSDRAVEAIWELRDRFKTVLDKYGYDGSRYPEKLWICTEYSLPRKAVGDYIGSDAAQCNFIIKTSVTAQQQNMAQMHYYSAADETPEGQSASEFAYMGFFKNLSDKVPYQHERNLAAYAHQTVSEQLRGKTYDPQHTAELNLPPAIRGGAFRDEQGNYTYALWAVTQTDMSEEASATYSFPAALGYSKLEQREWNHAQTHISSTVAADQVPLKGSPVFLSPQSSASTEGASKSLLQALLVPNPSDSRGTQLVFRLSESGAVSAQIFDAQGRPVQQPVSEVLMSAGVSQLPIDVSSLPAGTYFLRLSTPEGVQNLPLVRM